MCRIKCAWDNDHNSSDLCLYTLDGIEGFLPSKSTALAPRRLAHRARSLAPSGPRAAPRVPRATRRGWQYSARAASQTPRTPPAGCSPGRRVMHRRAADAAALRRRLPALSTEQASGGTAFHQLHEVRTSQRKHRMLPQHTQLCAAQRTSHATQSRPSVCPRGCLRKAWQARTRLLRGHALRAGATPPGMESRALPNLSDLFPIAARVPGFGLS